ncbi:MAG: glycosyltransferase [Nitrososphaerota archaeon]
MKLCVFPNEPLRNIVNKGSLIPGYYNPKDLFEEIVFITFTDRDVDCEEISVGVGKAKSKIISLGNYKYYDRIYPLLAAKRVIKVVAEIKPDVIRAYNPTIEGWIATYVGSKLNIPTIISIHGDYERDLIKEWFKRKDLIRAFYYLYLNYFICPKALKKARAVIAKYKFAQEWAVRKGATNVYLAYNKVDLHRFLQKSGERLFGDKPVILSVGRLIPEKNQEVLIKAIHYIDAKLILIGQDPTPDKSYERYLKKLVEDLNIKDKVDFISRVPNSEIHRYYHSADIYATGMYYGGVSIPVLEAMAAGLPVVTGKLDKEKGRELVDEVGIVVENTPEGFAEAFRTLIDNLELRSELGKKGQELIKKIDGEVKEKEIYISVLGGKSD